MPVGIPAPACGRGVFDRPGGISGISKKVPEIPDLNGAGKPGGLPRACFSLPPDESSAFFDGLGTGPPVWLPPAVKNPPYAVSGQDDEGVGRGVDPGGGVVIEENCGKKEDERGE